ncbi:MAG: hypothetical protein EXS08_09880 [Planctomycetes bacterium]|nr:hypothetical protein [Planctomycetota bacterium]
MSAAIVAFACLLTAHPAAQSGDWPHWRGLNHDGLSSGPGWSAQGETKWTVEVGLGYSSPSIAGGRLFVHGFERERGVDIVRCLQTQNGLELWRHELAARIFDQDHEGGTLTTPTIDGQRLYVSEREGRLVCYDAGTGRVLWHKELAPLYDVDPGRYGFSGSPLVAGELLIVHADRVFAFQKATGDLVWRTEPLQAVYSTPLPFTLGATPCVASFGQQALELVELASGARRATFPWQKDPRVVCAAAPVVVGQRLFISSAYEHGCALLDFTDGAARALWANRAMRSKMAGCVLVDGFLYGFDESLLKCLDLEGQERWRVRGLGNGALSAGDGKLALLSEDGELLVAAATPDAFHELARTPLFEGGSCWTPPVIAQSFVYCRNSRGTLVCRDHRASELTPTVEAAHTTVQSAPTVIQSAPTAVELPAAAELCARHLERIGGDAAVRRHAALRLRGTFEMRSQGYPPVPLTIDWQAPDRRRLTHEDAPPRRVTHERVFDGELYFEFDPYSARIPEAAAQGEARDSSELFAAADFARLYPELCTTALAAFDQRSCYRVEAVTRRGTARTLWFDAATGLLAGREGAHESLVVFDDYREFDGLRLATRERRFAPDTGIEERLCIERVEFVPVEPALFARPEAVQRLLRTSER